MALAVRHLGLGHYQAQLRSTIPCHVNHYRHSIPILGCSKSKARHKVVLVAVQNLSHLTDGILSPRNLRVAVLA